MFKIENLNKTQDLRETKSSRKIGQGESFASYLKTEDSTKMQGLNASAAVTSADAIFIAQTISDEEKKQIREKKLKKSKMLLDKLDEIRDGLLIGEIAKDKLIEISRFVKQKEINAADDDKLNEILAEIELRVEVELAKLMR